MTGPTTSPQWNRDTKILVTIIALVIFLALAYLARHVIPLLALAAVLAYIFQPVVGWLERRQVPRGLGAVFCLLLLLLMVALGPLLLTPPIVNGVPGRHEAENDRRHDYIRAAPDAPTPPLDSRSCWSCL